MESLLVHKVGREVVVRGPLPIGDEVADFVREGVRHSVPLGRPVSKAVNHYHVADSFTVGYAF